MNLFECHNQQITKSEETLADRFYPFILDEFHRIKAHLWLWKISVRNIQADRLSTMILLKKFYILIFINNLYKIDFIGNKEEISAKPISPLRWSS